jgi:hypothetical protein
MCRTSIGLPTARAKRQERHSCYCSSTLRPKRPDRETPQARQKNNARRRPGMPQKGACCAAQWHRNPLLLAVAAEQLTTDGSEQPWGGAGSGRNPRTSGGVRALGGTLPL